MYDLLRNPDIICLLCSFMSEYEMYEYVILRTHLGSFWLRSLFSWYTQSDRTSIFRIRITSGILCLVGDIRISLMVCRMNIICYAFYLVSIMLFTSANISGA